MCTIPPTQTRAIGRNSSNPKIAINRLFPGEKVPLIWRLGAAVCYSCSGDWERLWLWYI